MTIPNTREKLIELLAESEYMSFEKKADHLIANDVTILDKTDMPRTSKGQFYYDSNLGWYY